MPAVDDKTARLMVKKAGYSRVRLADSTVILRLEDAESATLQAWFEDCNRLMSYWQPEAPLRYIHDIRGAEVLTPYAVDYVTRVLRRMRYTWVQDGRGAIILNNASIAALLTTFFKQRPFSNWEIRFFRDEAEALRWVRQ
jgi:hypothetical protein